MRLSMHADAMALRTWLDCDSRFFFYLFFFNFNFSFFFFFNYFN